ncbi:MAG: MlaD family protein [Pirellulales bacterium]
MNNERTIQRRVGIVVIATAVIGSLLVAINTSGPLGWSRGTYEIKILLDSAPGVGVNTPVQKDGVLIGRVESVTPTADRRVLVEVSINKEWEIFDNDIVRVQPSSIFGDAVITFTSPPRHHVPSSAPTVPKVLQSTSAVDSTSPPIQFVAQEQPAPAPAVPLVPGPPQAQVRVIQPGETITGEVVPSPVDLLINIQADIGPAISSLARAGDEVANLADRVNKALGDDIEGRRIPELVDKTTLAMEDFSRTMKSIDAIVGDAENRQQFEATLDNSSKLVAEARTALADVQKTMESLDGAVSSLDRNLKNVEGLTEPIGKRGAELADLLISSLENFDVVMADLKKFTYALNSSDGTISRIVNDPLLYNNLNQTICNANKVIEGLNYTLWPIMENVKIFTDKIAREPGRIVGGAVNPSLVK